MDNRLEPLRQKIAAARRQVESDLVFKAAHVVNVFTGEILKADVAVCRGTIVGVGPEYRGKLEIRAEGKWLLPGLMDAHFHVESSMMTPRRLAEALLVHGTTAIVGDPHEIANVMGLPGIEFMLQDSRNIPFDIFFMAPSCVPATHLETSGAALEAPDILKLKNEPRILGLAEMMNFPGVLSGSAGVLEKIRVFENGIIDGHCPGLTGYDLQAYLSAGIGSDHETTQPQEALEKLRGGMMLMIREGTSAKNLEDLLPVIIRKNARRCCLVSDDLHPGDIARRGHLNFLVKKAGRLGLDPITAIRMVTLNPSTYFGFRDRGAVAPGFRADLVLLSDFENFKIDAVYKDGRQVVEEGSLVDFPKDTVVEFPSESGRLQIGPLSMDDFAIRHPGGKAKVIEIIEGQVITRLITASMPAKNGRVVADTDGDILKLFVVERHRASGRIGKGLVKGLGLVKGAIASSVAHDSHNIIAAGVEDDAIFKAVTALADMGGGFAVVADGAVLAKVPLAIAGLMSREPLHTLVSQLNGVNGAARGLGCGLHEPFMALSFVALPVIPEIKLSDKGLVDVNRMQLVPLFET
ncbi:MAG: adenine deaminase [Deltaproteobacteria bacterium]|nr:adenine deaminase [Deltaproteobacteria bacterium]